jgi:hypothetical protein
MRPTYQELLEVLKEAEEWATEHLEDLQVDADHHPVVLKMREVIARTEPQELPGESFPDDESLARQAGGEFIR